MGDCLNTIMQDYTGWAGFFITVHHIHPDYLRFGQQAE
jgi:hypothetical protein